MITVNHHKDRLTQKILLTVPRWDSPLALTNILRVLPWDSPQALMVTEMLKVQMLQGKFPQTI